MGFNSGFKGLIVPNAPIISGTIFVLKFSYSAYLILQVLLLA